jgi:hypothetical protein
MCVACLLALPLATGRRLGALAALTILTRPDGVVAAGIGMLRGWRDLRKALPVVVVPVVGWLLWQRWFHAWLPASVGVKADQGTTAKGGFSYPAGWRREVLDVCGGTVPAILVLALVVLGLIIAVTRQARPLLEVTLVVGIQQAAFALVPVPSYRWYYVPLLVVGLLHACYALDAVVAALRLAFRLPALAAAAGAVAVLVVFIGRAPTQDAPRESEFAQAAAMIRATPGQTVAAAEVGELAAALPTSTRVLDMTGLTTPAVPPSRRFGVVVLHWFPGPLRRDAVTAAAARYKRETGLRVDGGRQRREADGLPPGDPFPAEAAFLLDPAFHDRYALRGVLSRPGRYASLLVFQARAR